ncbi:MAG: neutral zinc metallopeptidase [Myxococcota bacterium]|nr:neutral zinc metallopeptidase [Myxococcota bacterium]
MRWKPGRRSRNLEDRRGERPRAPRAGFPFPLGRPSGRPRGRSGGRGGGRGRAPRLGLGGIVVLLVLVFLTRGEILKVLDPGALTQIPPSLEAGPAGSPVPGSAPGAGGTVASSPEEEELVDFVSFVLDDLQATWKSLLPDYRDARLVLFRDAVRSGCGFAQAQMGPFYCPADEKVYVDLSFFEELRRRFGAPGDFAQAYVLAHEIGHHIQKVSGIEPQVRRLQQQRPSQRNQLSVLMELQADCLAGVWGHSTARRDLLEPGDVEEGLRAAAAIGDDRIQQMSTGRVHPESFTHGSSEQRVEWLRRGLTGGDPEQCDTFGAGR